MRPSLQNRSTRPSAWLAERVAPHEQLTPVVAVDAIPKNPSGKLVRRVLRAQDAARSGSPA